MKTEIYEIPNSITQMFDEFAKANIVSVLLNLQPLWKIDNFKKGNNYDI